MLGNEIKKKIIIAPIYSKLYQDF